MIPIHEYAYAKFEQKEYNKKSGYFVFCRYCDKDITFVFDLNKYLAEVEKNTISHLLKCEKFSDSWKNKNNVYNSK
jgi:hypothetical protein